MNLSSYVPEIRRTTDVRPRGSRQSSCHAEARLGLTGVGPDAPATSQSGLQIVGGRSAARSSGRLGISRTPYAVAMELVLLLVVLGGLVGALLGSALLIWNPSEMANVVAVGIIGVSIAPIFPGMMSGMVLAGADPLVAGVYQFVIIAMILAAGGLTAIVAAILTRRGLFTPAQQLTLTTR
mgnify:CR=1 FL=1